MNPTLRKYAAGALLLGLVVIDSVSRILSVGMDLVLAGGLAYVLWPLVNAKTDK